jgi:hypothetical protein
VHHPGTVDYQLSANWDLYLHAVRGTDSTVASNFTTKAIPTTVHVPSVLILTALIPSIFRHLPRTLLRLRAQKPQSYLISADEIAENHVPKWPQKMVYVSPLFPVRDAYVI